MDKSLITTNQNAKVALSKSKKLLNITSMILGEKDEAWIERLWKWADENHIANNIIPRNKNELAIIKEINLSSIENNPNYDIDNGLMTNYKNNYKSKSKIDEIAKELYMLFALEKLDCSNNNLMKLPKGIKNLHNLTSLNLSHNNIYELTNEIGILSNLKELNISFNKLNKLPAEITQLQNVKYLFLKNDNLVLSYMQKKWLEKIQKKGAIVFI
ncbi:MAG: leucine-rich repeat domain-containing protein [Campylobacterota bacterium]|nr:leucine-rich repeat domain-containing protein [Campylobacterota bacterium]